VGLTVPAGAQTVWVQAETKDVRFRFDGEDPTASEGHLLYATDMPLVLNNVALIHAALFVEAEASAKLNVSYFGRLEE